MGSSQSSKVKAVVQEVLKESKFKSEIANSDEFSYMDHLLEALKKEGVESCNLILGIDFTRSNLSQGKASFHGESLHAVGTKHGANPYERSISIIASALKDYDDDGLIHSYIFGDIETKAHSVRPLSGDAEKLKLDSPDGVLAAYRKAVDRKGFSGPTSFAPLIDKAAEVVKESGNEFHILLIVADGVVEEVPGQNCYEETVNAIVRASSVPLSIVTVGVGDGPWDAMQNFDDGLPVRKFDNFQFVPFTKFFGLLERASDSERKIAESAFALCALQEVPAQYASMTRLGLIGVQAPPEKRQRT